MNNNQMHIDTILPNLKASNSKQVFQKLSTHISNIIGTPDKKLFDIFVRQEDSLNSGIGHGVAIAHAKLPRLTRPMIIYSKLEKSVHFNAADGELVDMVAVVLSPEFEGTKHLQRLAMVTRFFNDKQAREILHEANDFESIRNAVKIINERKKAA